MKVKWKVRNKKCGNRDKKKNVFCGLISRHKIAEGGSSECDDRSTEITQIQTQRERKKSGKNKTKHPRSMEYQTV